MKKRSIEGVMPSSDVQALFSKVQNYACIIKEKYASIWHFNEACLYADADKEDVDILDFLTNSERSIYSLFVALFDGYDCEFVTGTRYGKFRDVSYNYRDQYFEKGVSIIGLGDCDSDYYKNEFGGEKKIVSGYLLPYTGADGEPLLALCRE